MHRRRTAARTLSSDSSEDEPLANKIPKLKSKAKAHENADSSSDSDIGDYLQPVDKIDLNSSFFNPQKDSSPSFDKIENDIFAGVSKLTDSSSDDEPVASSSSSAYTKLNFGQLHEYTKKLEEAKRHVEKYKAKKQAENIQLDIENLLAAGESKLTDEKRAILEATLHSSDFESAESEQEGWEEVEEKQKEKDLIPKEGLQITVEMPNAVRKKKGVDLLAAIKRRINRVRKENQVLIHKVHLLCWLAHGNYVNSTINSQNILAVALSLLPSQQCYPEGRTDLKYLEQVVKWYSTAVINVDKSVPQGKTLEQLLEAQIAKKQAYDKKMLVYIFVAVLRSLGIQCRVVLSFQVEPLRPPNDELHSLSTKAKPGPSKKSAPTKSETGESSKNKRGEEKSRSAEPKPKSQQPTKTKSQSENKTEIKRKAPARVPQLDGVDDSDDEVFCQLDGTDDSSGPSKPNLRKLKQPQASCPVKKHPKRLKPVKPLKYKDSDSEDDFAVRGPFLEKNKNSPNLKKLKGFVPKGLDVRNDVINLVKKSIKEQKDLDRSKTVKKRKGTAGSDNDSDFAPEAIKKKHQESEDEFTPKVKVKKRIKVREDSEEEKKKKRRGVDAWAEVFLETEEKWISVDVIKGQVHCVNELFTRATHPVSYIVAWNNNNTLKDITRRYCQNFNTITRKLRVDAKWWEAALKPFLNPKTAREREEDEDLERQQLDKPLPNSIAEYKNHPLYVLKRHLLKFEGIYPPDPPPLGFVRKEPVYSRQCVYTLHSRDIWLKHAKVVKPGEQPYKIVKARPKWDKLSNKVINDQMLEIFGPWQTEDYVPPTAENGIVPRNAFGNVELFKPCMLPKKTVHLKLPGLNKVARRMDIDCAAAIVGFDFHGGWSHPTYDGFVVCEEYADILVAAWELEQDEIAKREQEKIEKRVYGNWRKLIRGLLIRERLKVKYEFGESSGGAGKKKGKGAPKFSTRKRKIESDSE